MNEEQRVTSSHQSSSPSVASDLEAVEWCLGLPLVEQRPLSADELFDLQEQTKQLQNKGRLTGCASPLLFGAALCVLAAVEPSAQGVVGIVVLFLLLPVAVLLLRANDAFTRSKGLRGDVNVAFVKRFCGPAEAFEGPLPEHLQDVASPSTSPAAEALSVQAVPTAPPVAREICIEVLPQSRRLWKVDGEVAAPWVTVEWISVAQVPGTAAQVAAWVKPLPVSLPADGEALPLEPHQQGRRELSVPEVEELTRRIRQLWLRHLWPAFFLSAWIGLPLSLHLLTDTPIRMEPTAYFLIAMALFCDYTLAKALWNARLLGRDVQDRYVTVLRLPESDVSLDDAGVASSPAITRSPTGGVVVEVLPLSGWIWTEGGAPAPWRKISG